MALFLKNAAASRANKPIPSAYYDGLPGAVRNGKERPNPVIQKLEQEIGLYTGYMKKRAAPGYEKPAEEAHSRPSDVLFELWNKYEPLLPKAYFHRRLLEMGDLLVSLQQYSLAERQCYSRYLDALGDFHVQLISDVDSFKKAFFPEGFQADEAGYTFRALMGRCICMFQAAKLEDSMLLNSATVQQCLQILSFLRLITQVVLPTDSLCWLVYNGTVHIYSICRHLMAHGHSASVLDYLLWASACMETSVPLLSVKYLSWRTTLYTAVCQCYYDCKSSAHAEAFARRSLVKVNELSQLEMHSNAVHGPETAAIFRQATVKMAIMVFKRTAFESRKKPKGLLRPKVRANMKDYMNLPWPRTPTEKLLVDMFEGSAAQYLCILETLSDSNRRTLITAPPAPDNEVEMLDVYSELFLAAQEIICGGGGTHIYSTPGALPHRAAGLVTMPGVVRGKTLIELAANGQDGVPLSAVIKLVKLAFCYEQWDVYDAMATNLYNYIKDLGSEAHLADQMALELMAAMEQLNSGRRRKHEMEAAEREREKEKEREKQERRHAAAAAAAASSDAAGVTSASLRAADTAAEGALEPVAVDELGQQLPSAGKPLKRAGNRNRNASGGNNNGGDKAAHLRSRATAASGGAHHSDGDAVSRDAGDPRKGKEEHFKETSSSAMTALLAPVASTRSFVTVDELTMLAQALQSIATTPSVTPAGFDLDMVVDSVLFLWNKCKAVFQKYQTGSNDNVKYLRKMESPSKWVYVLEVVHQVVGWCGLSYIDPALTAEVTLRLALVMEASAATKSATSTRLTSVTNDSERDVEDDASQPNHARYGGGTVMSTGGDLDLQDHASSVVHRYAASSAGGSTVLLKRTVREQLTAARSILELGLRNVSTARQVVTLNDGGATADIAWDKDLVLSVRSAAAASQLADHAVTGTSQQQQKQISTSEVGMRASLSKLTDHQPSTVTLSSEARNTTDDGTRMQPITTKQRLIPESKPQYDTAVWVTVKDLHMEMYFMYFKVCVRLSQLGAAPTDSKKSHRSARSTAMSDWCKEGQHSTLGQPPRDLLTGNDSATTEQLLSLCGKNCLIKAALLIQQAAVLTSQGQPAAAGRQLSLLEEAASLIGKAQAEEKRLHADNFAQARLPPEAAAAASNDCAASDVPPAPILLSRSETGMVLRPAAFKPKSGEKVAWYRLFCRNATGSNVKVRLNDNWFQGCGDEVPAFNCQLRVTGLQPQERYVFAVVAYTADGRIVGGSIGDTSRPILAALPLPVLLTWSYLAQISYQVGQHAITRLAVQVLWEHFTTAQPSDDSKVALANLPTMANDFKLTLPKLDKSSVEAASPVLLRAFLSSVFALVDVQSRELALHCDHLCDMPGSAAWAPAGAGQVARLRECEKLLAAVELAGWLNDAGAALQAAVTCYGLLAPLIYWRIPSPAAIQVLERCHIILQEIPQGFRQRRTDKVTESLHHMVACMTYYLAKVLRSRGQKALANRLSEAGRKLLGPDDGKDKPADTGYAKDDRSENGVASADDAEDGDEGMLTLAALKKKKGGKAAKLNNAKDEEMTTGNSELKALEAHLLRLSKQAQGEQELTGNEDPSILYAYIAFLPSRIAYKEVVKFKRRARYLEFLVQVVQKAISEGLAQLAVEWCEETLSWIAKRNEAVVGSKAIITKQIGAVAIQGDDPKKFAAAVVEFTRQKELLSPRTKGNASAKQRRKAKFKLMALPTGLTAEERAFREEQQIKAVEKLALHLPDKFKQATRRRRFRKVCAEELPWRSQLNLVLGLSHFRTFLNKLEMREKVLGTRSSLVYSTSFLDPEWFTFETAGVLVAGLSDLAGSLQQSSGAEERVRAEASQTLSRSRHVGSTGGGSGKLKSKAAGGGSKSDPEQVHRKNTGIEQAAAASTGAAPPPLFPIPELKRDSPRSGSPTGSPTEERKGSADMNIMPANMASDALALTFNYFCRAVVLAHRGQHWAVMQNAVYSLWNCYHTALMRATTYEKQTRSAAGLLSQDMLRQTMLPSLYTTCDLWLDMLFFMESEQTKRTKREDRSSSGASFSSNVEDEKGGLSLKFEPLLDDCTAVDMQFSRRLVGCTMEHLFIERKWEKLIHICLRFLALTGTRFVDQFVPMLIVAQRSLAEQLVQAGEFVPQPHMLEAQQRCGGSAITPRLYATKLELLLPVVTDENGVKRIVCHKSDGSAAIDPFSQSIVSDTALARKLSSVPVDFKSSLQLYQDSMSHASYNARALRHSRLLLVLYLGGLQQVAVSEALEPLLELQFNPHTAQPQPPVPVDPKTRAFASTSELQMVVMSRSQLEIVISSYEKTIEMLLAHNQKSLAAQALHELGNLGYHSRNTRGAYKWWSDALDLLLNVTDAVSTWHTALSKTSDIPKELLSRCGVWGCLLGGVLTSNISQYIMTSNLGLRTDCCYLSAYFFKAIFRASQPHPTADKDYASYDIGEGCDVNYLVPGIDFLSDRFRADGRGVLSALRWITEELSRGRHNLFVLPLLTLYQYFASNICRDLQRAVDSRILRVRALTDLAFFKDATVTLLKLLHGERLPNLGDSAFRQVESKMPPLLLDTAKPLSDVTNSKVLELLMDKRLSTNLSSFYGPHLTCQLTIAQAHLLIAIADTLPVVPTFDLRDKLESARPVPAAVTRAAPGPGWAGASTGPLPSTVGRAASAAADADAQAVLQQQLASSAALVGPSSDSLAMASNVAAGVLTPTESGPKSHSTASKTKVLEMRFLTVSGEFSQEKCKGLLLDAAEMMLTTISDTLLDAAAEEGGLENARAAELELWVQCQLNMTAVAQQRHHACMAAHIAFDALKMLMASNVFQEKKAARDDGGRRKSSMKGSHFGGNASTGVYGSVKLTDEQNNQFEFHNYQSRSRLDARLWLECKLALVKSLLEKNGGMGLIKGPITKVVVEIVDCRQYCAEGVAESEACNDAELQAEFLMQAAFLNMTEGLSLQVTRAVAEDAITLLRKVPHLSTMGCLLYVQALILLCDIDSLLGSPQQHGNDRVAGAADSILKVIVDAHDRILAQMLLLGNRVRSDESSVQLDDRLLLTPETPMPNVYLPHVPLLCQAKLRIAHLLACRATQLAGLWDDGFAKDLSASGSERRSAVPELHYRKALGVAVPALELCRAGARCSPATLAELLLETGKLQRHLAALSSSRQELDFAVTTLLDAVQVSHSADHNLNFIRQGYLEVAMAYLSVSSQAYSSSKRAGSAVDAGAEAEVTSATDLSAGIDGTASPSSMSVAQDGGRKKRKAATQAQLTREKTRYKKASDAEEEREKIAAMQAISCAALTTRAQYHCFMMNGDAALTSQALTADEWQSIPQFAVLDLVGDYVVGQKKKLYKDWVEEQMAPLVESLQQEPVPTYEEEVSCAQAEARDLGWVSLLGYRAILQRMCNHRTIAVKRPDSGETSQHAEDDSGSGGGTMAAHVSLAVHYPLCCSTWSLRVGYMHRYLVDKLPAYRDRCVAPLPPQGLMPMAAVIGGPALALSQSRLMFSSSAATSAAALTAPTGAAEPAADQTTFSSAIALQQQLLAAGGGTTAAAAFGGGAGGLLAGRVKEKSGVQQPQQAPMPDNELCVQWYAPPYELPALPGHLAAATAASVASGGAVVYLLYAASKKDKDTRSGARARYYTGLIGVPVAPLTDLHERLVELVQKAEILLVDKGGKKGAVTSSVQQQLQTTTTTSGTATKPKATASSLSLRSKQKAQSPKLKKDEAIETMLRQIMVDCYQIFGATLPMPQVTPPQPATGGESHTQGEPDTASQISQEPSSDESPKIPFEITIGNLRSLERLFNLSYGNVIPSGKMFSWLFNAIPTEKLS